MKSYVVGGVFAIAAGIAAAASAQPYPARPQCIGRVLLPPVAQSRAVRMLQTPGRVERRVTPAVIARGWRKVRVQAAAVARVRTPAVYRIVSTQVVERGPRHWVHAPPSYAVRRVRVVVSPGRWIWQRRFGVVASAPAHAGQTLVQPTGEVMCKVWCPTRYAEVERRVLVAPGRSYMAAAVRRRWVSHRVLVQPAGVALRHIPARYREVEVRRVITPARVRLVHVAPRYGEGYRRSWIAGGERWAPVVCGGPLTRAALQRMQSALIARGYDPGPPDGAERLQTYAALRRFQVDHRMAVGQITLESARALGVVP